MTKLLALVCLSLAISVVYSTSCAATVSLRSLFQFDNSLTNATTYSGLKYCKSIKNNPVCCSSADMNSFQTKSDDLIANLTAAIIIRDRSIVTATDFAIPNLKSTIQAFNVQMQSFILQSNDTAFDSYIDLDVIIGALSDFANATASLIGNFTALTGSFTSYQKSRTSCVVESVKLQNAAWCLACDPSAATKGLNSSTNAVGLSTRVCNRMKDSCFDYISGSTQQNTVLIMNYLTDIIGGLTILLNDIATGQISAVEDIAGELSNNDDQDDETTPGDLPDGCDTKAGCDWICNSLFENGVLDLGALFRGGVLDDSSNSTSRLLKRSQNSAGGTRLLTNRVLDSGNFDPDDDEAGVSVTMQDDPGNTTKFGGMRLGNMIISVMVMISSILLF